jgi:tetratricopeptide (TPR) repeat protein
VHVALEPGPYPSNATAGGADGAIYTHETYDAIKIAAAAIMSDPDGDNLVGALKSTGVNYVGASGTHTFDAAGDVLGTGYEVCQFDGTAFSCPRTWTADGGLTIRMEYFDEAIRLDPNNAAAYNNRGDSYAKLGQYEKAIEDFDEAIRLDPNYANAYHNRGITYAILGQNESAIENYTEVIRIDPNYANAYSFRGLAYANLGQHSKALQDYDEAIRLNPGNEVAINNRELAISNMN